MGASRLFALSPFSPGFASPVSPRHESPDLDSPSDARFSVSTVTPGDDDDDEDGEEQYSTAQWQLPTHTVLDDPPHIRRSSSSSFALTEGSPTGSDSDSDSGMSNRRTSQRNLPTCLRPPSPRRSLEKKTTRSTRYMMSICTRLHNHPPRKTGDESVRECSRPRPRRASSIPGIRPRPQLGSAVRAEMVSRRLYSPALPSRFPRGRSLRYPADGGCHLEIGKIRRPS
ncbi:hypothetical protein B0H10DRAFT_863650 [Mycena sp. CBHHK59/15]|nr:hypothetical protein B0H10DRAFT_863650 [Mycena sp. CBHHK59/15]